MYNEIPKKSHELLYYKSPSQKSKKGGGNKRYFSPFNMIRSPPLLLEKNEMRAIREPSKIDYYLFKNSYKGSYTENRTTPDIKTF